MDLPEGMGHMYGQMVEGTMGYRVSPGGLFKGEVQ